MTSNPRVSVLMPLYTPEPGYVRSAVESVLHQTLQDFELVVVEDPSSRTAEQVFREYADPRIRYFLNADRGSLIAQLNQGLQTTRADLVAVLDGDDVCIPTRLQRQLEYLQHHAEVSVLGSQITIIDQNGRKRGRRRYPLTHEAILHTLPRFNPLAHPSVMYRKGPVLDAGGYTFLQIEDFGPSFAVLDYELWARLARRGARFANHPESLLEYRVHSSAAKVTRLRETLRGTLELKRLYWQDQMDALGRARMLVERLMLRLPPKLVVRIFAATHFRRL
jgi:glycosyltransferase involved in cell wall biosynthesis